jgi:hypothetical protein
MVVTFAKFIIFLNIIAVYFHLMNDETYCLLLSRLLCMSQSHDSIITIISKVSCMLHLNARCSVKNDCLILEKASVLSFVAKKLSYVADQPKLRAVDDCQQLFM